MHKHFRGATALVVVSNDKVLGLPVVDVDLAVVLVGVQSAKLAETRSIASIKFSPKVNL